MSPEQPWTWWPWSGMWIFPLIMIGIMFVLCVLCMRRWRCHPPWKKVDSTPNSIRVESALDVLKKRYAKGDLTKEDFDRMKEDILNG